MGVGKEHGPPRTVVVQRDPQTGRETTVVALERLPRVLEKLVASGGRQVSFGGLRDAIDVLASAVVRVEPYEPSTDITHLTTKAQILEQARAAERNRMAVRECDEALRRRCIGGTEIVLRHPDGSLSTRWVARPLADVVLDVLFAAESDCYIDNGLGDSVLVRRSQIRDMRVVR
jgi:hypothetical protein